VYDAVMVLFNRADPCGTLCSLQRCSIGLGPIRIKIHFDSKCSWFVFRNVASCRATVLFNRFALGTPSYYLFCFVANRCPVVTTC
jgi:hypothetical protein